MSIVNGMGGMFGGCTFRPQLGCTTTSIVDNTDPFGDGSLIAKYLLDGDATDLCGNYDSDSENYSTYLSGVYNDCIAFTDKTGYVNVPNIGPICDYSKSWTVSFAWKWDGEQPNSKYWFLIHINDLAIEWANNANDGEIYFALLNGGTGDVIDRRFDDDTLFTDNNWHHTVIVHKEGVDDLFITIDGGVLTEEDAGLHDNGTFYRTDNMRIGNTADDEDKVSDSGLIDQVEIYNRALNPQEVQMLYTQSKYIADPTQSIPGLVAHYPLDGTAEDIQGYGANESGVEYNGVAFVDETKFGGSKVAVFDGSDDYVKIPIIGLSPSNYTMTAWVKTTGSGIFTSMLSDSFCYAQVNDDGYLRSYDLNEEVIGSTIVNDGKWHFLTVVKDNGVQSVWVDSIKEAEKDNGDNGDSGDRITCIGCYNTESSFLSGFIARVGFYNKALSDSEITDLYNQENETTDGLIAYYPLDGDASDYSTSNNAVLDGTINGDVSFANDDDYGDSVASFDGDGDYVSTQIVPAGGDKTLSCWFNMNGTSDTQGLISFPTTANEYQGTSLIIDGDKLEVSGRNGDGAFKSTSVDFTTTNEWHHAVGVLSGAVLTLYLDGEDVATLDMTDVSDDKDGVVIGCVNGDSVSYYTNGSIANVQIFNRALTSDEVNKLYNKETITSGLIAHYPLAEDATNKAGYYGTENGGLIYSEQYGDSVGSFDGVDDYIETTEMSLASEFTVTGWVKVIDLDSDEDVVIAINWNADASTRFGIKSDSDDDTSLSIQCGDDDAWHSIPGAIDNTWMFISVTYDGTDTVSKVYGETEVAFTTNVTLDNSKVCIGNFNSDSSGYFNGNVANVRIYDKALTAEQITDLYNKKDVTDGLVAHYPLTKEWRASDRWVAYNGTEVSNVYEEDSISVVSKFPSDVNSRIALNQKFNKTYTYGFWIKMPTDDTTFVPLSVYEGDDARGYFNLNRDDEQGSIITAYNDGSWTISDKLTGAYTDIKEWTYLVFVCKTDNVDVYADGIYTGNITSLPIEERDLYIMGGGPSNDSSDDDVYIKNVRIYNRALTEDEISTIYNYEKVTRNIVVDRGLVAYYPLKDNSNDHWVNQLDGTDNGDVSYDGVSASFDGDGDYIKLPNITQDTSRSMCCWLKTVDTNTHYFITNKDNSSTSDDIGESIQMSGDNLVASARWAVQGESATIDSGISPASDIWYFACVVVDADASTMTFYVGDTYSDTADVTFKATDEDKCMIGAIDDSGATGFANGKISNVRIYNRVLSPEEITTIYNTEKGEFE